jgi:hypothetical protein
MKVLEVEQVYVPDSYFKIMVKNIDDIPRDKDTVGYQDVHGDVYVFCESGVYIYEGLIEKTMRNK